MIKTIFSLDIRTGCLSSRIIDQKFPNYKTVIPESTENEAVIESNELNITLKRILIFKSRNNGVIFKFEKGKLDT